MVKTVHGDIVVFIVSNIAPYGYEINNIIGLPFGTYRLRYSQAWFALNEPFDIKGRNGLIVMRNVETAMFYPLRRVVVNQIIRGGDTYHIEFSLGKMIDLDSNETKMSSQVVRKDSFLLLEIKYESPNDPEVPPIPPVQIPIHIAPLKLYIVLRIINIMVFIIAVYILFLTEQFLMLFHISTTSSWIDIIQRLSILLMVLTGTTLGSAARTLTSLIDLSVSSFQSGKKI